MSDINDSTWEEEAEDELVICPCGCGTMITGDEAKYFDDDDDDDDDYDDLDDYPDDDDDDDDDYDDDDDSMMISGATSTCPWEFSIPENLNEKLSNEKGKSYSDSNPSYKKRLWAKVWPKVEPDRIDPAQAAADYYLLFGLVHNSFVEFEPLVLPTKEKFEEAGKILGKSAEDITKRHAEIFEVAEKDPRTELTKLSKKANGLYHDLVEDLDGCFREYVHLACGGELRHHSAMGPSLGKGFRRGAWVRWFYIYQDNGPEALLKMADLFEEFGGGSYGGPPWANAARILYQREVGELGPDDFTNKQLFVDRCFTLEHNGGCFLNKLSWINKREDRDAPYSYHFGDMKSYVLEAHASNPVNIDMLYGYASKEIQDLVKEYLAIATSNNIDVVGLWKGSLTQKKEEKKEADKVDTGPIAGGVIDWSTEESTTEVKTHINPLVAELEKSLLGNKVPKAKPTFKFSSDEISLADILGD